jgi:hypothetical protein
MAPVKRWVSLFALCAIAPSCDTGDVTCTEMRNSYTARIARLCSQQDAADGPGPSNFCNTCVAVELYDYTAAPTGQCACAQLVIADTNCAATYDNQALLSGIKGAGMECVSFSVGSDAAAPKDASGDVFVDGAGFDEANGLPGDSGDASTE